MEMPKSITRTLYLLAQSAPWNECGYSFSIAEFELSNTQTLGTMEVTMAIPRGYDFTTGQIDILKAEKEKIQAEAHLKAENIENQIQALLAIEHKPVD